MPNDILVFYYIILKNIHVYLYCYVHTLASRVVQALAAPGALGNTQRDTTEKSLGVCPVNTLKCPVNVE
jgi:hypothetical protein